MVLAKVGRVSQEIVTKHVFPANGWVGWTKKKSPLELSFVFKYFQSIQEVNIVAYNKPDMGIEVR